MVDRLLAVVAAYHRAQQDRLAPPAQRCRRSN